MLRQPLSLRVLSGLLVLVMGVLGMTLAVVTGEIYHRLTLENQRQGLAGLAGLAVDDALVRLEEKSRSLGLSVQSVPDFERALRGGDYSAIRRLLDDQFHQYFVTAGEIRLAQLRLFSPAFELLAESGEGARSFSPARAACPGLLEKAAERTGPERLRFISDLCADNAPLYSLIVPIGGLVLRGYLEVVADPAYSLESLEKTLGMPLRLSMDSGQVLYRSAAWPADGVMSSRLAVDYPVHNSAGRIVLHATLLSDVTDLRSQLGATRRDILLTASLATLLVAVGVYWVLRRTTLEPIAQLVQRLQNYQRGGTVEAAGAPAGAVREFHDLRDVYRSLDRLAHTDPLTLLPNRKQFRDCLEMHGARERRHAAGFALMIMDLNGFKQVNDRFGHQVGDQLLHQVARRLAGVMRSGDVLALLGQPDAARRGEELLARLGGDEFGVLLPGVTDRVAAGAVAGKLLNAMRDPLHVGDCACEVGLSIGIAFYPADAIDLDVLVNQADAAMYAAKRKGGGHVCAGSLGEPD